MKFDSLGIRKLYNGAWEVFHIPSGVGAQRRYLHWSRKWHAEEYRQRLKAIPNIAWTQSRAELQAYDRSLGGACSRQVLAIEETLRAELMRGTRQGWPVWKTRNEFYERTNT